MGRPRACQIELNPPLFLLLCLFLVLFLLVLVLVLDLDCLAHLLHTTACPTLPLAPTSEESERGYVRPMALGL